MVINILLIDSRINTIGKLQIFGLNLQDNVFQN